MKIEKEELARKRRLRRKSHHNIEKISYLRNHTNSTKIVGHARTSRPIKKDRKYAGIRGPGKYLRNYDFDPKSMKKKTPLN